MTADEPAHRGHLLRQYDDELEALRQHLLEMAGLVEDQLDQGLTALLDGDAELGEAMVRRDSEVNSREVTIDEECTRIMALRQPTAGDLRFLVATFKIITDLERVGDEACKLGRAATEPRREPALDLRLARALRGLGRDVADMLRNAVDALARLDDTAAVSIAREESRIDGEHDALTRQLVTYMMEDPRLIRQVLGILWSARALERIADHARNICEYVIYIAGGKDVRHAALKAAMGPALDAESGDAGPEPQ